MAMLHIQSGVAKGRAFELTGDLVTVGRAPVNMICLPDDLVSIYHATLTRDGNTYRLRDLNSSNYTFVNGSRIVEMKLTDGDQVRFGEVEARYDTTVRVAAPPPIPAPPPAYNVAASPPAEPAKTAWGPVPPVMSQQPISSFTFSMPLAPPPTPPPAPPPQSSRKIGVPRGVIVGVTIVMVAMLITLGFVGGRLWEMIKSAKDRPATPPATPEVATQTEPPPAMPPEPDAVAPKLSIPSMIEQLTPPAPPPAVPPPDTTPATKTEPEPMPPPSTPEPMVPPESDQPIVAPSPGSRAPIVPVEPEPKPESTQKVPEPAPPAAPQVAMKTPDQPTKELVPLPKTPPVVKPNPYDGAGVLASQNQVDQLVMGQLQRLGIQPASICSDATFVRRVYLDVIGTLPTAEEAQAFLEDRNPVKRSALIDKLLERDEFADYWAMKWCDLLRVKSEFPINLWPNAVQAYHQWIRNSLKQNRPYDRFARDLLTSSGSNFREPPVNFYRAVQSKDPQTLAQTVALTFMGTRAEKWPKEQLDGLVTFFAQVGYKATSEWKEEIVFFDPSKATNVTAAAVFPDGKAVELPVAKDPRVVFADWLITPTNPWFTRNIVNRVWSWLFGRGVVHEPDDIRPDNPPSNPELLALLERELITNKYDLKSVYKLILKSRTYQLSSVPRSNDPRAEANFAYYPVRRLEAEVMIDAVNQITGSTEKYSSPIPEPFTFIPENERSIALADGSISSPFLELFGRSSRASGMEAERSNRPTAAQQLHLLNSSHILRKIEQSAKLRALTQQTKGKTRTAVDGLYLTILSRYPTDEELRVISAYDKAGDTSQRTGMDIAWALINSAEFQHRH